jgi:hypothetical protein
MRCESLRVLTRLTRLGLVGLVAALSLVLPARADEACVADAKNVSTYLRVNDAGVVEELQQQGPQRLDGLDAQLLPQAAQAQSLAACAELLRRHLQAVRPGHLSLDWTGLPPAVAAAAPSDAANLPFELRQVAGVPVLILRSFSTAYQNELHAVIARLGDTWRRGGRLVIDLRGNTGGADSVWSPLLDLTLGSPITVYGVRWWATPANAQALGEMAQAAGDASAEWRETVSARAQKLRSAASGSWLAFGPVSATYEPPHAARAIAHVALVVDKGCAGSCEQMVMDIGGARNVTIWGQPTLGMLDAGNLGRYSLPGGRAQLNYALSMTQRPRAQQVDGKGITPARDLGDVPAERWMATVAACDLQWPCAQPPVRVAPPRSGVRGKAGKGGAAAPAKGRKGSRAGTAGKPSARASGSRAGAVKVASNSRKAPAKRR